MSKRTKIIVGVIGVVLVLGLAAFFFLRYQIRKSFPQVSGRITVTGLYSPVEVYRDEYGVPRVRAENEHDLIIAAGYVHAQDRLWQMDLVRRVGEGRLSELFGSTTVPFDRMFRTIGIRRIAEAIETRIDSLSHRRLEWYAEGVNAFIGMHTGRYPVEFDMLGYDPEPWEPVHTIMIGRLMAWELNLSWWTDLTLGALLEKVGRARAMEVFPPYPGSVAPTVPASAMRSFAVGGTELLHTAQAYREFMGSPGMQGGSNAWVIGPSKSASGGVLLANDTHLQLQNPSKWYEVQYSIPGYTISGMSIPGTPGVVSGHTTRIAWGITNVMADDADFYIERLDSTGSHYLYNGSWLPIVMRHEEIIVRGDTTVPVTIRSTRHGPIVTDIRTPLKKAELPFVASMRWTGYEISDQLDAFHSINTARNWKEFISGVRKFSGPGQNFVYGDVDGNIGYWCGVKLPIRGDLNSTLPLPGWESGSEWKGFVPFDQLPHLYNPPDGYIATANNKIADDHYPYFISNLWEPSSRIVRLRERLGRNELFSPEDCTRLQNDAFSHVAAEMTPLILAALRTSPDTVDDARVLGEYFENWNFVFDASDVPTAIFHEFYVRLLNNIYRDEMGEELFHDFVILVNIPIRVT
ncbi:MAG: penicillin acylase family protein, partial [Ignavibacteria bacterium]|nr:penicillin acylase family protein [Ignavibacteria bacterium]